MNKRYLIFAGILIFLAIGYGWLSGLRLNETSAIGASMF